MVNKITKKNENNKLDRIYIFLICLLTIYFQENIFSFDDYKYKNIFSLLNKGILVYLVYKFLKGIKKLKKLELLYLIITAIFYCYYIHLSKVLFIVLLVVHSNLLLIKNKKDIYIVFYKILSLICFFGMLEYMLFILFDIRFKFLEIIPMEQLKVINSTIYLKGYFMSLLSSYGNILYRFQSIFGEPGTLGTLIGMLFLFDNNLKNLRKERIVLFMSGVLTLSSAFFIFLFFKIISYPLKIKNKIIVFMVFLILLIMSSQILKKNNRDVYDKTFIRVFSIYKENNRESQEAKLVLDKFIFSKQSLLGTGREFPKDYPEIDASSWRLIVYHRGYLTFLILITYFLCISKFFLRRIYLKLSVIFFLSSIYQRPGILTPANLLILLTGLEYAEFCYSERVKNIEKISYDNNVNI